MMLRLLLLLATVLLYSAAPAQTTDHGGQVARAIEAKRASGTRFNTVNLFTTPQRTAATDALWSGALRNARVLRLEPAAVAALRMARSAFITMELPTDEGSVIVDLERKNITTDGFNVIAASSGAPVGYQPGVHFQGMVRGVAGSTAAVSVFDNEVMAIISDNNGERVLGRLENDTQGYHVFYHENDLRASFGNVCHTPDSDLGAEDQGSIDLSASRTLRCVRFYWEVNYDIFQNKGTVANTTNYVTGLFNQSAILYANDGISVLLNEVFVWDVVSPYTQTTTSALLDQFGVTRTSFNGDMAHLLGYAGGGGLAWVNTLCSSQTRYRMAYSDINSTYSNVPTYSWSVEVVTHEQGHNLGSRHTHACVWNGNNTAIDGCGPAAGYTEGTCAAGPVPTSTVGGTIMSYCHLVSAGIKFANGFGPQPAALIVSRVNSSTCLPTCGTSCDPPIPLSVGSLNATSANLGWTNVGATSYTLQWKPASSGTWTTVTGLTVFTYALSSLTAGTAYEFRVLSVCAASNSVYSPIYSFTTPVPCPDALEPNNSTATAPTITLPISINALIASSSDVDYYKFVLTATSTINLYLSNLAGDFDMRLLNSAGTQLAVSQNGGTTNESINYPNAAAGTYYIHIFGYNGAFSASQCYLLTASAVAACVAPTGLLASNVTYNSATIGWSVVQGVTSYDLRWRILGAPTWTDVLGLVTNSHALTGLQAVTDYEVQVRSVCAGTQGGNSAYSASLEFTTMAAPCEVQPPIRIAVRVLLEGPYVGTPFAMHDSLRTLGLIPLQEPYTALGYAVNSTVSTTASVLAVAGANAIVDWVLVELRNASTPALIVETRAGLLQRNGDVVAVDGVSALGFCSAAGNYRIAVRHRNHFGALTASSIALSASAVAVDMSITATPMYGTNARKSISAVYALWAGNTNGDNELIYAGANNDRDPILVTVGGTVPTGTVAGYHVTDVNMDGKVRYVGAFNDRDPILNNVGGSVPTNTLLEQLP